MIRPSGSCAAPSQKTLSGALTVVNVWGVAGFQTYDGSGCCQPSQKTKLPLSVKMELTASNGMFCTALHWPCGCGLGVTRPVAADWGPVPTAFAAATVNLYVVPLASPGTTAVVAGGLPVTVVPGCAVPPMYGVIV